MLYIDTRPPSSRPRPKAPAHTGHLQRHHARLCGQGGIGLAMHTHITIVLALWPPGCCLHNQTCIHATGSLSKQEACTGTSSYFSTHGFEAGVPASHITIHSEVICLQLDWQPSLCGSANSVSSTIALSAMHWALPLRAVRFCLGDVAAASPCLPQQMKWPCMGHQAGPRSSH